MTASRLIVLASLALPTVAQAPSAWSDWSVPAGVTTTALSSQGKLVVYRDPNQLAVFCAFTRGWRSLAISAGASLYLTNDCLLVRDGAVWSALSAYSGAFVPLAVSPAAQLLNSTAQVNDAIVLVADGGQLHAFTAFTGTWVSRPLAGAYGFAVQRQVGVIAEGNTLSAIDAFSGQWHSVTVAAAPTLLSADGSVVLAQGQNRVHAFSAHHRAWRSQELLGASTFHRGDEWGAFEVNGTVLAYSGVRGEFCKADLGAAAAIATQDSFALFATPNGTFAYSALRGEFSSALAPAAATTEASTAVALLREPARLTAYSPISNRASPVSMAAANTGTANVIAFAIDGATGVARFFSAITGQWHTAPADTLPGIPTLTATAAGIERPAGGYAFSGLSGSFVPLAGSPLNFRGNANSAPLLAFDHSRFAAFDPWLERWVTTPRSSTTPPLVQIWRLTATVVDGGMALGFGAQAGEWQTTPIAGSPLQARTNSESANLAMANVVHAYAPTPLTLPAAQFPHFRRLQAVGTDLTVFVTAPLGGIAVTVIGARLEAPVPLPGLGELWLDPAVSSAFLIVAPTTAAPALTVALPASRALAGFPLCAQSLVLPAAGAPYLTTAAGVLPQ